MRRKDRNNAGNNRPMTRRERALAEKQAFINASIDKAAQIDGPTKKTWSLHDLKYIKPITDNQTNAFHGFNQTDHLIMTGSAGTGKTLLALFFAIRDVIDPSFPQRKVRILRSSVSTRDIGFLPGTEEEKMEPYEAPYRGVCQFLFGKGSTYDDMKEAGLIEFNSSSFARGDTWTNEIVIVDEIQNLTFHELNTIATRLGKNSRLILVGDGKQNDLTGNGQTSGFAQVIKVANMVPSMSHVEFGIEDIVRSGFVKEWIIAVEKLGLLQVK